MYPVVLSSGLAGINSDLSSLKEISTLFVHEQLLSGIHMSIYKIGKVVFVIVEGTTTESITSGEKDVYRNLPEGYKPKYGNIFLCSAQAGSRFLMHLDYGSSRIGLYYVLDKIQAKDNIYGSFSYIAE